MKNNFRSRLLAVGLSVVTAASTLTPVSAFAEETEVPAAQDIEVVSAKEAQPEDPPKAEEKEASSKEVPAESEETSSKAADTEAKDAQATSEPEKEEADPQSAQSDAEEAEEAASTPSAPEEGEAEGPASDAEKAEEPESGAEVVTGANGELVFVIKTSGGTVSVSYEEGKEKKELRVLEDGTKTVNKEAVKTEDDRILTIEEKEGTAVHTEVKADTGYHVAFYRIKTDSGSKEEKLPEGADAYKKDLSVIGKQTVEIGFEKNAEEKAAGTKDVKDMTDEEVIAEWEALEKQLIAEAHANHTNGIILTGRALELCERYDSIKGMAGKRRMRLLAANVSVIRGTYWNKNGEYYDCVRSSEWYHLSSWNRYDANTNRSVYCVDLDMSFMTPRDYSAISYSASEKERRELGYVLANGVQNVRETAANSKYSVGDAYFDYYVAQLAVWAIVKDYGHTDGNGKSAGASISSLTANTGRNSMSTQILEKAKLLYNDAKKASEAADVVIEEPASTTMTLNADKSAYVSGTYKVITKGAVSSLKVSLEGAPEGAEIVYESGSDPTQGFTIKVPKDSAESGEFTIKASGSYTDLPLLYFGRDSYQRVVMGGTTTTKSASDTAKASIEANGKAKLVKKVAGGATYCQNNPMYSLAGALYGVYSDEGCKTEVGELQTDARGNTGEIELPAGDYYVKEKTAPKGYALDTKAHKVTVEPEQTATVNVTDTPLNDPIKLLLTKKDAETGKPQNQMRLEGAVYEIRYYEVDSDTEPDIMDRYRWTFKTDANGRIYFDDPSYAVKAEGCPTNEDGVFIMPLGTFTVREIEAPAGYLLDPTVYVCNTVSDKGGTVTTTNLGTEGVISSEQPIRGNFRFTKVDDSRNVLANVPFEIKSADGKTQTVYTDENGVADTSKADIWFGDGKKEAGKGKLLYGTYTVTELPCKENFGKNLVSFEVTVRNNGENVDLGEIVNKSITIRTTAADKASGTKTVPADAKAQIVDTVKYSGLTPGDSDTIKGVLMDKKTGKELTVGGKSVTAEADFTPKAESGNTTVTFTFDSSALEGTTIVVFEKLFHNGTEIQNHEDINDVDQTVSVPSGKTTAKDAQTESQVGAAVKTAKITDRFTYTGLDPKVSYLVTGTLHYKDNGEVVKDAKGKEVTATATLTGDTHPADGYVDVVFEFDASLLQGKTVVAFEKVTSDGRTVIAHEDINDQPQTVYYPDVKTTAKDGTTDSHAGIVGTKERIIDTVSYSNLVKGVEYTVKGTLYNAETGESLGVNAKTAFTADKASGTVELTFEVDSTLLQGKSAVVFEDLYKGDVKVASHADLTDKEQTVSYPEIKTSAKDAATGTKQVSVSKETKIIDTVTYKNLVVGDSYTIKGRLMNKENGTEIPLLNKAEVTFTAEKAEGTIEVELVFDAEALEGGSTVVFEKIYQNDIELAIHEDLEDKDQTVVIPKIRTNASDGKTKGHTGTVGTKETIVDVVSYEGLIPGTKYTVEGTLVFKESGEPVTGTDGKEVTASASFTAKDAEGTIELVYELDSTILAGKTVVVFEDLLTEGVKIASHADINDEEQTVYYPEIKTSAKDAATETKQVTAYEDAKIIDTVTFKNLKVGETYTITGRLMNKATGAEIPLKNKAEETFLADKANGSIEMELVFDAKALEGETTVVFEKLLNNGVEVTAHEDLEDEDQTVEIPKIRTNASDSQTKTHTGTVGKTETIVDVVTYENLIVGKSYVMEGYLVNKETGKPVLAGGEKITAKTEFTAEEKNGSVELTFTIDSSILEGATVVVFEDLRIGELNVASHADINDEEQSVHYPKVRTKARVGGKQQVTAGGTVKLIDTVSYSNLVPGKEYVVKGILMDKATGKALLVNGKEVTAEKKFTAKTADGTVEMTFTFASSALGGKTVVVFEDLYEGDVKVASHSDINDKEQSIVVNHPPKTPKKNPKTGDASPIVMWSALMLIAAAAMVWAFRKKKAH